ncbi:MAG: HPr kinase/phosphorylase [Gammaproteobacteria bacterium]|nr:HPr kinase/phosphorylase [Gammaproteobacteria bacterium]
MTSTPQLSAETIFNAYEELLGLTWLGGKNGRHRPLEQVNAKYPGLALVGHLSLIHPNRVQVLGKNELAYIEDMGPEDRQDILRKIFTSQYCSAIIIADSLTPPSGFIDNANAQNMPLLVSTEPSPRLIDALQYYLTTAMAQRLTEHGVFMEVMGIGVLLTGDAGVGKSEIALELLSRNHRLIADDAVELSRVSPQLLEGRCPEALRDFMEVRGLGILDVRAMFGETATKRAKYLRLIVRLEQMGKQAMAQLDRLQAETQTRTILGIRVPEVIIPIAPGRNLAVLVEAAVRNHIQHMRGKNALHDFMEQQQSVMRRNEIPINDVTTDQQKE